ncbi:Pentatricopeptide repeat (PPR-like) superfamily protein [Euphorbia peplus]|nr:Pentatricopeptide repeat (PPR-like) superfamily protein [Euphorbia peplus]
MEPNLSSFCRKFLIKLSRTFVSYVLRSTKVHRNPDVASRFFEWAGLSLCLGQFKELVFLMNLSCSNSLIRSFGNLGMIEELLWMWKRMKENEIEPSLFTYNFLINGLVNSKFIESAERIFEVMESGKIGPDVVMYNTMMKGYCETGKTQRAFEKFRAMESRNVAPDKSTYMTLIQSCYAEGDFDSCLGLYQEMDEKGFEIPPHVYSLVIGGLCK